MVSGSVFWRSQMLDVLLLKFVHSVQMKQTNKQLQLKKRLSMEDQNGG